MIATAAMLVAAAVAPAQLPAARCDAAPRVATELAPALADSGRLYRGSLSRDGRTLYYFRKVTPGQEDYRILRSTRTGARWSAPVQLDLAGGNTSELYPTLAPDGSRLVFSSYRPVPGDTSVHRNAHLWYVDRRGDGWGTPVFMADASELGHYHSGPVLGADGAVRFRRTTPDWRTGTSMITRPSGAGFGKAEVYDELAHWYAPPNRDLHVWSAQWGPGRRSVLLEVARRDPRTGRPGSTDLWIAVQDGEVWREPVPLGAGVNTAGQEHFASIVSDECTLLFTRDYSTLHHVSLAAAMAGAAPGPVAWQPPPGEVTPAGINGSYRGAFVREGSVQLVNAGIGIARDSLRIGLATPDRLFPLPTSPLVRDGDRLRFPTPYGPMEARIDTVFGEIFGAAVRNGVTTTLHLKRALPSPEPVFERREVTFPGAGGVTIAGTIVLPTGVPVRWAVAYVAGRGCGTRAGGLQVLEVLAPYGVAGIAIDKRGMGRSTGNCPFATIQQFSGDALAALEQLRGAVPPGTPSGFLGNSAGGWVSVHAAARAPRPVDFVMMTVGPGTSVRQQQLDATRAVGQRMGLTPEQLRRAERYIDLMFLRENSQAQFDEMMATVEWARGIGFADQFFERSDIPTSVAGLDSLWVRLNDYDPAPDLARLRIPILALYGGADEVVPAALNVAALRRAATQAAVTTVVVPEGDHGLSQPSGEFLFGEARHFRFGRLSPLYFEEMLRFLRARN